jgi:demethylmenaquinone methyltransferase/2-methoxy-6-polyprenyl-1,4-benzoquinol methylase
LVLLLKRHFKALDKKKKIIENYDLTAHFYDKRYKTIQEKKYNIVLNNYQLKEKKILDVGCGTGLLIEFILNSEIYNRNLRCKFVALDISWKMLLEFKSKLLGLKNKPNISLVLSDIENLPLRDNIFNLIFSFTSFQNLPETHEGIQELIRVASINSDLKFSILKKKLRLGSLIDFLKPNVKDLEIFNEEFLEDIIIQCKISKESF